VLRLEWIWPRSLHAGLFYTPRLGFGVVAARSGLVFGETRYVWRGARAVRALVLAGTIYNIDDINVVSSQFHV